MLNQRFLMFCIEFVAAASLFGQRQTIPLFQDNFGALGTRLNPAAWTTEVGCTSFLGRTQLADWVTPGGVGQFVVAADGAHLALNTFNPTGFSLYGTHGKTLQSFEPGFNTPVVFTARLQLTSLQPGLVYGVYFYSIPFPCSNQTQHDEIDIELVTNLLQPGNPPAVQLNSFANEPLGAGNGVVVNLPSGFNPLAPHDWSINWSLSHLDYLVDGVLLYSTTTHVPQGPMQADVIAWGPAQDWPTAYGASLQPVNNAALNQSFVALLTSVSVSTSRVVQPSGAGIFRAGLWVFDANNNFLWDGAPPDLVFLLGQPGDVSVVGDWNGDGHLKAGIFRNGLWILDYNGNGRWDGPSVDRAFNLGQAGDTPVVGDWNSDGRKKAGVFRNGLWVLDFNGNGQWDGPLVDRVISLGQAGDIPIAGDWNGSGFDKVGVFRAGLWVLDYNGNGLWDGPGADRLFGLGQRGDTPIVGDWNGSGSTKAGVFTAGGFWAIDYNGNGQWDGPSIDRAVSLGQAGDVPLVGDWNGSGFAKIGVFRCGLWVLDFDGNWLFDGPTSDKVFSLGQCGDSPVVGAW